jgi:hypothetical protein
MQEATFLPETSLASPDVETKTMLALANVAVIPAFTPMKRNADKKIIPATSGADVIIGLTVPMHGSGLPNSTAPAYIEQLGLPIQTTDTLIAVYTEAKVYNGAINWAFIETLNPTTINSDAKKQACFDMTEIDVIFNTAGF